MNRIRTKRSRSTTLHWAAVLGVVAMMSGCGEQGPQKYTVSGKVTYGGKPISSGDIRFEPKEGMNNAETGGFSRISDGKYTAEVVGGPHSVYVRDLTGDVDMGDPKNPGGRALFRMQYHGSVELPKLEEAKGGPVEKDIEVPTTHK